MKYDSPMKGLTMLALTLAVGVCFAQDQPYRGEATAVPNVAKDKPPVTVSIDGKPVKFDDVQPQPVAGRMMVPVRGVFESLGIYVEYEIAMRTVTARKGNDDIEMRIGERVAHKDGAEILLDVAPLLLKGHAMVPLRFIVETLGGTVNFDPKTNHIDIITRVPADPDGG